MSKQKQLADRISKVLEDSGITNTFMVHQRPDYFTQVLVEPFISFNGIVFDYNEELTDKDILLRISERLRAFCEKFEKAAIGVPSHPLDEFISHHGLTPEIVKRDYGFSYCIEELEGCVWTEFENLGLDLLQKLQGGTTWSCGKGKTEEEAKDNFAEFISGRLLVFRKGDRVIRQFVRCPCVLSECTVKFICDTPGCEACDEPHFKGHKIIYNPTFSGPGLPPSQPPYPA